MHTWKSLVTLCFLTIVTAQTGFTPAIVERCPGFDNASEIACVNRFAAVLPYPFTRASAANGVDPDNDTFVDSSVPSDPSFALLKHAPFVIFDQGRGLDILGASVPQLERVFNTRNDSTHEAPVYVPGLNAILYSLAHQGIYEQQIINLNVTPPTLANYTTQPPVYAVNGGRWYQGHIYWAAEASFAFPDPSDANVTVHQTPGIYKLNPWTREVVTLANNYFGTLLNSPNDLVIDSRGDVWFTDPWYGYGINVTTFPVHAPATYRFRPSTGALSIVENTLAQPNGIGISPDGRTLYLTDTGVFDFAPATALGVLPRYTYNPLAGSSVYAFDVNFAPPGNYLSGRRPVYLAETFADDGFHVTREGYLVGAAGSSVDILSEFGELIMKIEVGGLINNLQFAGKDRDELWMFGPSGIWRVSGMKGLRGMAEE